MASSGLARAIVTLRGVVQGVGFRPFVSRLAHALELSGDVRNAGGELVAAVEGATPSVERFVLEIETPAPPGAAILEKNPRWSTPTGTREFRVAPSSEASTAGFVGVDRATCDECPAEHDDPGNRFFAVGFETTAPANALAVEAARRAKLTSFSVLSAQVLVAPALSAIC